MRRLEFSELQNSPFTRLFGYVLYEDGDGCNVEEIRAVPETNLVYIDCDYVLAPAQWAAVAKAASAPTIDESSFIYVGYFMDPYCLEKDTPPEDPLHGWEMSFDEIAALEYGQPTVAGEAYLQNAFCYSPSGKWGLCFPELHAGILGGSSAFLSAFREASGTTQIQDIRKWFVSNEDLLSKSRESLDRHTRFLIGMVGIPTRNRWLREFEKKIGARFESESAPDFYERLFPGSE